MAIEMNVGKQPAATVYFDGACPVCRREIGFYRGRQGAEALRWIDVSGPAPDLPEGVAQADALARFHVRRSDGRVVSGAAAFVELWSEVQGFRWLARIGRVPPVLWVMERAYRGFLRVRRWGR